VDGLAEALYDVAAALFTLPILALFLGRDAGSGLSERLGRLPASVRSLAPAPLWIHAASVGEVWAAAPLVEQVRRRRAEIQLLISTTTVSGRAVAEKLQPDAVTLLPIDGWRVVDRVLAAVRPRALVLVETEIWPGLLRAAQRTGTPVVVVSGRLSERSWRRARWVGPLYRAALKRVAAFGMQSEEDARRIVALGAPAERVQVAGSLKAGGLGAVPESAVEGLDGRPVLVAASTQPGEEEFVLEAARDLWDVSPELLLVVAPRRPERFDTVAGLVERSGLRYQRRSAMRDAVRPETQILLLDTLGELTGALPKCRAAFVGGTVAALGGHNVLEPALFGVPVAFGPHTENVATAARALLESTAGVRVQRPEDLCEVWTHWLRSPAEAAAAGARARAVASSLSAAVACNWALLEPYLGTR
jgi:3-deoxy-D-manno-octulosonic-acid transferase